MRETTYEQPTATSGLFGNRAALRPSPEPESAVRIASRIVPLAIVFGILGDRALEANLNGIGPAIWLAFGWAGLNLMSAGRVDEQRREWAMLVGAGLLLAALLVWRESEAFTAVTVLSMIALGVLAVSVARGSPFRSVADARAFDALPAAARTAAAALFGAGRLFGPLSRNESLRKSGAGIRGPLIRGLLITVPIAVVFIALFASADRDFAALVDRLTFDTGELAAHTIRAMVLAWIAAGIWAHGAGLGRDTVADTGISLSFGRVELTMLLGTLNVIFAVFIALQLPHLFGGNALVQSADGPTYAEYARRGFIELVFASGLTLAVLAAAQGLAARDRDTTRVIRILGGLLVALTFVVMQSAIHRLGLYTDAYGWTLDRLYAAAVIGWVALAFVWAALTLLGTHPRRFLAGVAASGVAVLVSLAALNPEGFVATKNLARSERGRPLDLMLLASLGGDAAPAMARGLPRVPSTVLDEAVAVKENLNPCRAMHNYVRRVERDRGWLGWTIAGNAAKSARPAIRSWTSARCGAPEATAAPAAGS